MAQKVQDVLGALLPPQVPRSPNAMSLEELSGREEWKKLSPRLRQILTAYISSGCTSLNDVLAAFEPYASHEKVEQAADAILARADVQDALALHAGSNLKQREN